jgi:hypothetical protein
MRRPVLTPLLAFLALAGACSSGTTPDPAAATGTSSSGPSADSDDEGPAADGLCDATAALFALPEAASEAEAEAVVDAIADHAPDQVADDVATLLELGATADGLGAYTDPDYTAADAAVTDAVLDDCDQDPLRIGAGDYVFDGLPAELDAGRVAIELTNSSASEVHELSLLRKDDEVDATFEELFELPDDEATDAVSPYGTTIVGPGATTFLVSDLPPGEAVDGQEAGRQVLAGGGGEPHVARGMFQTFTVTS